MRCRSCRAMQPPLCTAKQPALMQALFASPELRRGLVRHGFLKEAVFMETVHEAFEAMDARHLTPDQRTQRLQRRTALLLRLLGNRPFLPLQSLPATMHGLTSQQVCSWLGNADSRLHLLARLPREQRGQLNERSLNSYPCESLFASMVNRCGFKPAANTLDGMLSTVADRAAGNA